MLLPVAAALLTALALALWIGSRRQQRALAAQVKTLMRAAGSAPSQRSIESLDSLPAPVTRYLRWLNQVLKSG